MSDFVDARIPDGFKAAPSVPSLRTAGTDEAEADAPDTVAADPAVVDAERDPSYRDDVQHRPSVFLQALAKLPPPPRTVIRGATYDALALEAELVRRSRLSRWQKVVR